MEDRGSKAIPGRSLVVYFRVAQQTEDHSGAQEPHAPGSAESEALSGKYDNVREKKDGKLFTEKEANSYHVFREQCDACRRVRA